MAPSSRSGGGERSAPDSCEAGREAGEDAASELGRVAEERRVVLHGSGGNRSRVGGKPARSEKRRPPRFPSEKWPLHASTRVRTSPADLVLFWSPDCPRDQAGKTFLPLALHLPGRSKATKRDKIVILGRSRRARRRNRRRFSGVSLTPGGNVRAWAPCDGSTSENPISSWGPLPRIRHRRSNVGTLGITPPRSMRPYTSGALPMPSATSA
jgi:hypothetical protein